MKYQTNFQNIWACLPTLPGLCCSRKYSYPSHGRFFCLDPLPVWKFQFFTVVSYFPLKTLHWRPPPPLFSKFPITFCGRGMENYFLEPHIPVLVSLWGFERLNMAISFLLSWMLIDKNTPFHLMTKTFVPLVLL